MSDDFSDFRGRLEQQLRARPPGTLARFTSFSGAFWTGQSLKGIFIGSDDDGSEALDEEFDIPFAWENWRLDLEAWLCAPVFEHRVELEDWIERRIA